MKCARCGVDSKRKERANGRCPHCGGLFAFKQVKNDPVSDASFARAIEVVSAGGQLRWGVEHLYYEISRRVRRIRHAAATWVPMVFAGGIAFGVLAMTRFDRRIGFVLVLVLITLSVFLFRWARRWNMSKSTFEELWKRWCATHGTPKGLIVRRQEIGQGPQRAQEPDIELYSFDRAVICDRARTVDLLLANNFHFENNCAVLSMNGYPSAAFATVLSMLRRNPRLKIFALHDCTREGCAMARELVSNPKWFPGQRVVDVGMRPHHARKLPNVLVNHETVAPALGISAGELEWLQGHSAELAVLRPEQVLRRLFQAMNKVGDDENESDSDEGGVSSDDDSFLADDGGDDGGADSFG